MRACFGLCRTGTTERLFNRMPWLRLLISFGIGEDMDEDMALPFCEKREKALEE